MFTTNAIARRLPQTRIKLFFARILYILIRIFLRSNLVHVKRHGIHYLLDISEGIELSIFIFGRFQNIILKNRFYTLPQDAVIFDVGANIGSMSLAFSQNAPQGHVYAFEPTDYAFKKLLKNLDLNPKLKSRITTAKCFASNKSLYAPMLMATSSWKTNHFFSKGHPVHGGITKSSGNAPSITLDDYCLKQAISRLDLIKIDTEGQELDVIKGAMSCIRRFKPIIIFEAGQYIMDENGFDFKDIERVLEELNYRFYSLQSGMEITGLNDQTIIPRLSTIDIIARPS
ncbi:MAG: FkbM family methyltransferase [Proteobacteria bacterium]|nr:FkbM family methyltransferase [Pseudomonadota bacterium]